MTRCLKPAGAVPDKEVAGWITKKLIIDMIQEMKNKDFIRMIYFFVKALHEKEKRP